MTPRLLIVLGSARKRGNTWLAVDAAFAGREAQLIDLLDYRVSFYDYERPAGRDNFLTIAEEMAVADAIVFATPVYWYAMSAPMKALFDRLTDLISARKDIGHRLRGRAVYLMASGTDPELPDGFEVPFAWACRYLGMRYTGAFYSHVRSDLVLDETTKAAARAFGGAVLGLGDTT